MKGRDKHNILFPSGFGLLDHIKVQEITDDVFKTDNLYIAILPADFSPEVSLKYRMELEAKWLNVIPTLDNIKSIYIRHNVDQQFFDAICCMKNLERLSIRTSNLKDISCISKLNKLKRLDIDSFIKLSDISPLLSLKHLEILTITNCFKITNYETIGQLTNLVGLAIIGNEIAPKNLKLKSLTPFSRLKKLKHLDITSTRVIDDSYDTLLQMDKLQRLDLSNLIKKPLRDEIKKLPKLVSGFFVDFDWDKKRFYKGKEW